MNALLVLGAIAGLAALFGWLVWFLCKVIDNLKEWLG